MQVGLYMLLVLHIAEGCKLKDRKFEEITAYTGGSALLPCYCTDPQATPGRFTWKKLYTDIDILEEMSSESGQYRDKFQLVNGHSPGNLSLLISLLTEEDGGDYRCYLESRYTDIRLTVKGCTLTNRQKTLYITAHTGGSVLLPCSCTELRVKPKTFTWMKYNQKWDRIPFESGQYRDRVQLVNGHSPGNLSLLISHLTEEDGGDYRCDLPSGYTDIRLTVKAATAKPMTITSPSIYKPNPQSTGKSDGSSTVISTKSHTQQDVSSPSTKELIIYATVGGLLLLMVLIGVIYWRYRAKRQGQMEDGERKPEWRRDQETQNEVLFTTVNEDNRNKIKKTDDYEGLYAGVNKAKCTKVENDDVTYSTVVHNKRSTPATVLLDTEETTEYASIKLN
uniref:Ig-like domain-containing protein n=1 Tax=Pygocentrus nattereri TaxID=42514 RepID=A0AAR2JQB5_PYGNA